MKEQRLREFIEATEIEVPEERVAEIAEQMSSETLYNTRYEHMIMGRSMMLDQYEEMAEQVRNEAYEQAKTQLVLEEVVKREGFEVTKEELEAATKALATRLELPEDAVKNFLGDDLASLKNDILIQKAIDFITG